MIRREVVSRGAEPSAWVLIDQIEHALLARKLAEHWGSSGFWPLEPREPLLWACEHHDDGWAAWDHQPQVDPHSGVPRQFLEMHPEESIDIWTQSIEAAAMAGPLEAYLVAGHFCRLGRRVVGDKQDDSAWEAFIKFLEDYESRAHDWRQKWQSAHPSHTSALAERALDQLQFFDTFSLWFCCSESTERETVETPAGIDLQIHPLNTVQIRLSPWPLRVDMLELSVPGRLIAARPYADAAELAAAPSQAVTLRWRLTPEE